MFDDLKGLEEVREVNRCFPLSEPIKQWKHQGKKVIGWTCTYVPEEIIYAGGALPVRLVADSKEVELDDANAYLYTASCSFTRSILQLAIENRFDFIDGVVFAASCDGMRRLQDVWQRYLPIPIIHTLVIPRKWTDWSAELFRTEVLILKEKLEEFLGTAISDKALEEAVEVYNRGRELLGRLYELRKSATPPISGTEVAEVLNASCWMPRHDFNGLLERLLAELEISGRKLESNIRLMVNGSILNTPDFLRCIEELGALVVVDEVCSGIRYWSDLVQTANGLSVLDNICSRYLNKFPCPRMQPMTRRFDRVLTLVQEYRVGGVINQVIRHCVVQAWDEPILRERLWEMGVPVLELDKEYATPGTGQVRTRVQAFLEMIQGRKMETLEAV